MALVFSLFVLQKDPKEEPPLHYRPWPGGLCREQSRLQRLRNTFSWQLDFFWVVESPWGSWLAGLAMVLLCAFLETWATSCLASLQTQPAGSAACLVNIHPALKVQPLMGRIPSGHLEAKPRGQCGRDCRLSQLVPKWCSLPANWSKLVKRHGGRTTDTPCWVAS